MFKHKKNYTTLVAASVLLVFVGFALTTALIKPAMAATGRLYINQSTISVQQNNNISLTLRIDPGQAVQAVETTITYDSTKLQFLAQDTSSSPFDAKIKQNATTGKIENDRFVISSGIVSDSPIVTVTFKALASGGSSTINVSGNSSSGGNYLNPAVSGATINFSALPGTASVATPTPTATQSPSSNPATSTTTKPSTNSTVKTPTPTPTSSASQTVTPVPSKNPSGTASSIGEMKNIEFTRASAAVNCNLPLKVWMLFGLDDNLSFSTSPTECKNTTDIKLDEKYLKPGTTYKYKIVSQDQNGNITEGDVQTFNTKGYTVKIIVLDKNNNPFKNQKVTLRSEPITNVTDKKGIVTFENVAPGEHKLLYSQGGKEYSQSLTVQDNILIGDDGVQYAEPQNITVLFGVTAKPTFNYLLLLLVAVILLIAIGVMVFLLKIKKRGSNKPTKYDTPVDNGTNNMNNPNIGTVTNDAVIQAQRPDQIVSPQVKNYEVKNDDIV